MVNRFILIIAISFATSIFAAEPKEQDRVRYGTKMYEAFITQSLGKTREAFYQFRDAYQEALKLGESNRKLFAIQELFIWYRKYGYSLGFMKTPADCVGEVLPSPGRQFDLSTANPSRYQSEWGNDPIQSGKIREVMVAVGEIISSVFLISIGTPPIKLLGGSVCWDGFTRLWNACNGLAVDYECAALQRLKELEEKTKNLN